MLEADFIPIICAIFYGGATEVGHAYEMADASHTIRVDCESETEVVEVGLDRRSSLDSVQQALFASLVTVKDPVVALVDTDGSEGRFEYRIRKAAGAAGVRYSVYRGDFLIRWLMGGGRP